MSSRSSAKEFPFSSRSPLVPDILVSGPAAGEIVEPPDPWAFTESCLLRGFGAGLAGGAMGFMFGAVFSGYGSLQPLDPSMHAAARVAPGASGTAPAAAALPGGLPYSHLEPPKIPLLQAVKEGLIDVRPQAPTKMTPPTARFFYLPLFFSPTPPPLPFCLGSR